ncbi:MAG TPA: hypothetical protein VK796_02880 [Cytophaga sp.]|nr:hypothetical protein [Cytophaga sp.]
MVIAISSVSCHSSDKKAGRFDNIAQTDTTCLKELEAARKDFKEGKLFYCNNAGFVGLRCENEMVELLDPYNITFKNSSPVCIRFEGQTEHCYCYCMKDQIENKYGKTFIDSLLYIADSTYISKHLDDTFDYTQWDEKPFYPGDKKSDNSNMNHSGLQADFDKLARYPDNYEYKADSTSMAMVKVHLKVDAFGNAKAEVVEFIFWNSKTKKDDFNKEVYKPFEKIILTLIEKTKWAPAKIKSFTIKSEDEIFIAFK